MAVAIPDSGRDTIGKRQPISIGGMSGQVQGVNAKDNLILIQLTGLDKLPSFCDVIVSTSMSLAFSGSFDGKTVGSDPSKYRYIYKYNPKAVPEKINVAIMDNRASKSQSYSIRIKSYIDTVEVVSKPDKPSTGGGDSGGGTTPKDSSTTTKPQDSRTMQENNSGGNNNKGVKPPKAPIFKSTSSQADGKNKLKRMAFRFDGKTHYLRLNPEEYSQIEASRSTITQTKGGAWVDDFGANIISINLRGTTGFKSAGGKSATAGFDKLKSLRDMIRKYYNKDAPGQPITKNMTFHNFTDGEHWVVHVNSFTLARNVSRPLLYMYDIKLSVLRVSGSIKYKGTESRYQYTLRNLPKKYK